MKPIQSVRWLVLMGIVLSVRAPTAQANDIFTFAGFTFDQRNTPNQGARLGNNADLGGALFSAGFATQATINPINFPQGDPGFNTNLSLAQLSGLKTGLYAVNLPNGDNGTTNRHGLEVSWSNGRGIANLPGKDFVVYESASTIDATEGVMARVRTNWVSDGWTDWYYFAPTNFQSTIGANGCHSYGFDASSMGVADDAPFDKIQIANLMQADRISGTSTNVGGNLVGEGKVVFDGSISVFPDAGALFDSDRVFSTSQFDPDPLYLAALHPAYELNPPQLSISQYGAQAVLTWPAPTGFSLQMASGLGISNTVWTAANNAIVITNGLNLTTIATTNGTHLFRLARP